MAHCLLKVVDPWFRPIVDASVTRSNSWKQGNKPFQNLKASPLFSAKNRKIIAFKNMISKWNNIGMRPGKKCLVDVALLLFWVVHPRSRSQARDTTVKRYSNLLLLLKTSFVLPVCQYCNVSSYVIWQHISILLSKLKRIKTLSAASACCCFYYGGIISTTQTKAFLKRLRKKVYLK